MEQWDTASGGNIRQVNQFYKSPNNRFFREK